MGCNNTNVKEDLKNENEINKNQENNSKNKNQEDIESNLDDDNIGVNNINNKYNENNLKKEDVKGILNLYTNKISKTKLYNVPGIIILNPKNPEDKKPPDLNKLKKKKKEKPKEDYN